MITLPRMFGFLNRFAEAKTQARVMVDLIDVWQRDRPLAHLWDVKKFTEDGYRRNTLVFACVKGIATSFSQPPMYACVTNNKDEETPLPPGHMLARLLERPNKRESQAAFLRAYSTNIDVAGNVYTLKVRNGSGMPIELRRLRADLTKPVPDSNGDITSYAYGVEPNTQSIPADDVIHEMCDPDPIDPYRGLSPIAVLARVGDLDNAAADYLRAFFLNAGIPSGLLKYKEKVPPEERERMQTLWKERYSSLRGWFNVSVLDGDVTYEEIGSKIRTMDLSSIFGQTETRICMVYGVPPILIGSWIGLEHGTYANYASARKSFYQETLTPKWMGTADRFTSDLASEFGENIEIKFDLSGIDALQEEQAISRKFALDSWTSGLATKDESRAMVGLPPAVDGAMFKSTGMAGNSPPDAIATQALFPISNQHLLADPSDIQGALLEAEWKILHAIADKAAPTLKKKYFEPSRIRRAAFQ